jgi:hypothetical protein
VEDGDLPFTGGELTAAARVASAIRKLLRRPDPVAVLKYRQRIREEIRENLPSSGSSSPEIIVVRLSKKDRYPSTDSLFFGLFKASAWTKTSVRRLHDRGLEVFIAIEEVTIRKGKARRAVGKKKGWRGAKPRKVWVVGRIPYERIAYIDWEPDPAYSSPRFYVNYGPRGPYREVALYESSPWPGQETRGRPDLFEVHDVKYQGEAGNPWRWLAFTASRLRFAMQVRRQDKRDRREYDT